MPKKRMPIPLTHSIRNDLIRALREKEIKRLNDMSTRLANSAKEHLPKNASGFFFKGEEFYPETGLVLNKKSLRSLPHQFKPDAQLISDQRMVLLEDLQSINQALGILLLHAKGWQDVRDALYEGLVELHPTLSIMSRTRPEMFLLPEHSKARQQYLEVRPLIEQYCVMRMIS
jgi:hypothetical protein